MNERDTKESSAKVHKKSENTLERWPMPSFFFYTPCVSIAVLLAHQAAAKRASLSPLAPLKNVDSLNPQIDDL